jgi:hypothetical protein
MTNRPKFAIGVAQPYLAAQVEKKLLGGKFIRLSRLLTTGGFLFETGAVLGLAFHDCIDKFVVAYSCDDPNQRSGLPFIQEEGNRIAAVADRVSTINELFITYAMLQDDPSQQKSSWSEWLVARGNEKIPLEPAGALSMMFGSRGVGFALRAPDRFQELYVSSYANQDRRSWAEAYKHGAVNTPEPPEFVPLSERQEDAVAEFADFCRQFYPELLTPLGLTAR